ncbi:GIY-YIG nuclease family protein [Streptomyces mirabilis]|uniref:GIY-YIG nuclease family protein n=1 Tax=Streptomyces mirabilis TaxID=68239 RepID=UPI00368B84F9
MKTPVSQEAHTAVTATPQPLKRLPTVVERVVGALVWTTQAAAVITYLAIAATPSTWLTTLDKDPVATICTWLFVLCMAGIWVASLWEEQRRFYDRLAQRSHRRAGLLGHFSVLFIAAMAVWDRPHRVGLWAVLGILCFAALVTWMSWMQVKLLPDEDQAVIDTVISREVAQRRAAYDASERQKRRQRLTAIVESLGYTLTDAPVEASKPAEPPAVKWTIPAGKHAPLVYFIRNGNRMKIGTTVELKRRIRTLALRPENVALLVDGDQRRERAFHNQFAEHRIGTTEWFAYEGTLADYVNEQVSEAARKGKQQ